MLCALPPATRPVQALQPQYCASLAAAALCQPCTLSNCRAVHSCYNHGAAVLRSQSASLAIMGYPSAPTQRLDVAPRRRTLPGYPSAALLAATQAAALHLKSASSHGLPRLVQTVLGILN